MKDKGITNEEHERFTRKAQERLARVDETAAMLRDAEMSLMIAFTRRNPPPDEALLALTVYGDALLAHHNAVEKERRG